MKAKPLLIIKENYMGCKNCDKAQELNETYFFRWKNANVALLGCREHIKEIIEWLRYDDFFEMEIE